MTCTKVSLPLLLSFLSHTEKCVLRLKSFADFAQSQRVFSTTFLSSKSTDSFSLKDALSGKSCLAEQSHVPPEKCTAYQALTEFFLFSMTSAFSYQSLSLPKQCAAKTRKLLPSIGFENLAGKNLKRHLKHAFKVQALF